ncbi:MAG: GNAT family N-acetyltransferase [Ruminobacter sp.]|nr:GNAT family N-acetyltransferase [Ruminobacter sp.]
MKHNYKVNGFCYRLRPVTLDDAQFIIDTRLEDAAKSQFVHKISTDVSKQIEWLNNYFEREGDYYFVVENLFTKEREGLISVYDIHGNVGEWGRWVFKRGSLGAIESVNLIYKFAFETLHLSEIYTHTISDNVSVVNFHKSINAKFRTILKEACELNGKLFDMTEQYADSDYYKAEIKPNLEAKCIKLFERNIKSKFGKFKLHHYGVAAQSIEEELKNYPTFEKGDYFEDPIQGVAGLFINSTTDKTCYELLQNLENSNTVTPYLRNDNHVYHAGYLVDDIDGIFNFLVKELGAKVVSDLKQSVYFKGKICFLMLKNRYMIELMEDVVN